MSQAKHIILDVADQPGMSKEIAELGIKRAFGRLKQLDTDKVENVRIIGKDFDTTVTFVK